MACDYRAIRRDNERRYGTDIGRIGPMLLSDRYDDRTHFIYELLQNAEDALTKRQNCGGKRSVLFVLNDKELRAIHCGKPFDEADVRGICGIAESTKDLTAIGRFGIGFKSVYAFTDRPEVHSGGESFAIESYVWPVVVPDVQREAEETLVILPLRSPSDWVDIETGLKRLGPGSLLFLREIDGIEWRVEGGSSGLYLRSEPEWLSDDVRRISVIGQSDRTPDVEESWLLFSRPINTPQGKEAGYVEVAFSIVKNISSGGKELRPVRRSPLVVFFPTVVETHLGFLVQGPYRTTPSRDNVPPQDEWNQHCVAETAAVLCRAFRWLRDSGFLDVAALHCLPLDRSKFPDGAMFAPIFQQVRNMLSEEALLPRHGGGYISAKQARLARSQGLRELLSPAQLAMLLDERIELAWLSGDISHERPPELRDYLVQELSIEEVRPETILSNFTGPFLEAQPDEWIRRLYEFLGDQKALLFRAEELPLIRLTNGKHVQAQLDGQPQAFLPGTIATGFPTVRAAVCETAAARDFLVSLGLTEPDAVDDVVRNILPKYVGAEARKTEVEYEADINRILVGFATDSKSQRERLLEALRQTPFVAAIEQCRKLRRMAKPGDVYLATERLLELFAGVEDVLIIDNGLACLKGEDVRTLLIACGCDRYLDPTPIAGRLTRKQSTAIRREEGLERASWEAPIEDVTLRGLTELLSLMPRLQVGEASARAQALWGALADLESRRGSGSFLATYKWGYSHESKTAKFDAHFVKMMNEKEWVPDADGKLYPPGQIVFDSLGWKPNPFLLSKIRFRPPVIDQLAREAGIEPGVLDLLKKLGVTSEAELRARLGVSEVSPPDNERANSGVDDALARLGITQTPTPPARDPAADDAKSSGGPGGRSGGSRGPSAGGGKRSPGSVGGRPFISYVAVHPDDEASDPDGLDQTERIALEAKAVDQILSREPDWQRTATNNPGFDLFKLGPEGQPICWCEVKAMTGCLKDRPVGLSRIQFEFAHERGDAYWLYAVERAGTEDARIVRIQDPAGKASTFTFDRGWLMVAQVDPKLKQFEE